MILDLERLRIEGVQGWREIIRNVPEHHPY